MSRIAIHPYFVPDALRARYDKLDRPTRRQVLRAARSEARENHSAFDIDAEYYVVRAKHFGDAKTVDQKVAEALCV